MTIRIEVAGRSLELSLRSRTVGSGIVKTVAWPSHTILPAPPTPELIDAVAREVARRLKDNPDLPNVA